MEQADSGSRKLSCSVCGEGVIYDMINVNRTLYAPYGVPPEESLELFRDYSIHIVCMHCGTVGDIRIPAENMQVIGGPLSPEIVINVAGHDAEYWREQMRNGNWTP